MFLYSSSYIVIIKYFTEILQNFSLKKSLGLVSGDIESYLCTDCAEQLTP